MGIVSVVTQLIVPNYKEQQPTDHDQKWKVDLSNDCEYDVTELVLLMLHAKCNPDIEVQ